MVMVKMMLVKSSLEEFLKDIGGAADGVDYGVVEGAEEGCTYKAVKEAEVVLRENKKGLKSIETR